MENRETNYSSAPTGKATSAAAIGLAWLLVGVPLAWGVFQTVIKSLALFK